MPAKIVLVHDDQDLISGLRGKCEGRGQSCAAFTDPIAALDALSTATLAELLVTGVQFPAGRPHGVALARMARLRRPDIKVLFISPPEYIEHVDDLGEFILFPTDIPTIMTAIDRVLCAANATSVAR